MSICILKLQKLHRKNWFSDSIGIDCLIDYQFQWDCRNTAGHKIHFNMSYVIFILLKLNFDFVTTNKLNLINKTTQLQLFNWLQCLILFYFFVYLNSTDDFGMQIFLHCFYIFSKSIWVLSHFPFALISLWCQHN